MTSTRAQSESKCMQASESRSSSSVQAQEAAQRRANSKTQEMPWTVDMGNIVLPIKRVVHTHISQERRPACHASQEHPLCCELCDRVFIPTHSLRIETCRGPKRRASPTACPNETKTIQCRSERTNDGLSGANRAHGCTHTRGQAVASFYPTDGGWEHLQNPIHIMTHSNASPNLQL
jgi:hypothetical protein